MRVRVLAIGDIHTETELLERALAVGRDKGVERVLSVGDIVDGPNDPLACITVINAGTLVLLQEPCCVIADFHVGTVEHYSLLPSVKLATTWP